MRAIGQSAPTPPYHNAEAIWDRLAAQTPSPDPFCATTHWQLAFREAIDPHRPLIVKGCADGLIHFVGHGLAGARALGPIERNWLFGCNLLGPAALDLMQDLLAEMRQSPCPLVVAGLDPHGDRLRAMRARLGARYTFERLRSEVQCAASLEGGFDGFLARRSGNFRRNLRRAGRRAAEQGVRFERHNPAAAAEAEMVFARMLTVELASWKGIGRCGMESPSMTRFYSIMLRRLSRSGDGRVMFATQDGRDIGFIFGGMSGGVYRGQQFSFDDRCAALSIGNLMQFEQVRWLCEEGAARYDLGPLLGPSMEYKYHWTELQLPIEAWVIHPR